MPGVWTRGLLIRRNIADGDLAFFSTWCPTGTSIETLVTVEGHRWAIEDSFETAKNKLGLDHNETRSWHGWHRHVSLVMLAFAMMAVIRHRANAMPPQKRCGPQGAERAINPLVNLGNPPHRHPHRTLIHHRLVALATSTSGRCTTSTPKIKIATVMLG